MICHMGKGLNPAMCRVNNKWIECSSASVTQWTTISSFLCIYYSIQKLVAQDLLQETQVRIQ